MAWARPLQCVDTSVSIVVDPVGGPRTSIVDSYAWIRFELPYIGNENAPHEMKKARRVASVLRAAVLTWSALSHCQAYGTRERPAFWKRVFCALQPKKATLVGPLGGANNTSVRDSIGLFDQPSLVFPRIMVVMPGRVLAGHIEAVMESFGGDWTLEEHEQATLSQSLARLKAFADPMRPHGQSIQLCLALPASTLTRTVGELSAIAETINATAQLSNTFQLQQVRLEGLTKLDDDADASTFSSFVDRLRVPVAPAAISSNMGDTTAAGFATALRSLLQFNNERQHNGATLALTFRHDRMMDANFQALFSALPFATCVHSVSLSVRSETRPFDARELPWIAYAIFHPRASRSSWRQLELRDLTLRPEAKPVLAAMARGNNLMSLLVGEKPTSDAYVSGLLQGGSIIYMKPSDTSEPMLVVPGSNTLEVDVCGVPSGSSPAAWSEWVAVVVPAYGLGWVRSASVISAHAHKPSVPHLKALRLGRPAHCASVDIADSSVCCESLVSFVHEFGGNLRSLDIESFGATPASTIYRLLECCPALNVLRADTTGTLTVSAITKTALQEMALRVRASEVRGLLAQFSVDWRDQLQALRINIGGEATFQQNQRQVAQLLADATSLRYLHWDEREANMRACIARAPPSYDTRCQFSQRAIDGLRVPHGADVRYAQGAFSASCAAAVLSVVGLKLRREDQNEAADPGRSAMGRLHVDVLRNIFEFATSPVQRTICIEQE